MSLWFDIVLAVLGVVALCLGVFLIYVPAGFVTMGVALITIAYFLRALEVKTDGAS